MLRWMLIAVVVLHGVLLAAAPTTRPYSAKTLDDAIRELHDRGLPATMDDLQGPAIPDDKNGADYLRRAAAAIVAKTSGPRSSSLEYGPSLPYPRAWFDLAEAAEKANVGARGLVRKARDCGGQISWDMNAQLAPAERMQQVLKWLSALRELSNLVTDEALLEHFNGNDAAAFELGSDSIYLVKANDRRPFLVSALVSGGIRALVAENYRLMAVNMKFAGGEAGGKGAERHEVKEAIAWFLDDAAIRDGARRCILEERAYALAEAKSSGYASNPAWQADLPAALGMYDDLASRADLPLWEPIKLANEPKGPFRQLYVGLAKTVDQWRQGMCRIILEQRMAAVSLATAMYYHDKGTYPIALQDLVPDYLPGLPIDPYSRTGEPLLYSVLAGGKRPRLGSVGRDGADGQQEDETPPQARYDITFVRPGVTPDDIWIDLVGWTREGGK